LSLFQFFTPVALLNLGFNFNRRVSVLFSHCDYLHTLATFLQFYQYYFKVSAELDDGESEKPSEMRKNVKEH